MPVETQKKKQNDNIHNQLQIMNISRKLKWRKALLTNLCCIGLTGLVVGAATHPLAALSCLPLLILAGQSYKLRDLDLQILIRGCCICIGFPALVLSAINLFLK